MVADEYQYRPIGQDQFRVLEISKLEPLLQGQLVRHSHRAYPEYYALSYAWGNEGNVEIIECDGQKFRVTRHLLEGLKSISTVAGITSFWVDAVCINQNNNIEKAQQVSNMHQIYRNATSVIVWLGSSLDDSDLVMDAIAKASLIEIPRIPKDEDEALVAILRYSENAPTLFDSAVFTAIARFSERSWFRRLWIVQEYFYAREITFFCGKASLEEDRFIKALKNISIHSFGHSVPRAFEDEDASTLWRGFRMLTSLHRLKYNQKRLSLFELVLHGRDRLVKEPVDRIYAVYGMIDDNDDYYRKSIEIDYSADNRREYWNVYVAFSKLALLHEPNLRLLTVVDSMNRPKELPSWCPNLNSTPSTSHITGMYAAGWPPNGDQAPISCPNFKSKDDCHFSFESSQNLLRIWGCRLDIVHAIQRDPVPDPQFDQNHLHTAKPWAFSMRKWLRSCENTCERVITDHNQAKIAWNEILVGSRNNTKRRTENSDLGAYSVLEMVLDQITCLDTPDVTDDSTSDLPTYFGPVYLWITTIVDQWNNRVLFATNDGKLGFARHSIMEGDQLCMFYGGRLIYILRESPEQNASEKQYVLVSEAYVFNHMDGEIFDLLRQGSLHEELFPII